MFSEDEFASHGAELKLSEAARELIAAIRASPPSRRVRGGAGNVVVRYPSRKMGFVIQDESHKAELAGIYEYEYDEDVLEYYDQPPPIKLRYETDKRKQIGVIHTPDFFVIRGQTAGWEEWKPQVTGRDDRAR
ncbi:MAG: TnsA endonuclease N-terminal domain-containing protein [Candidatus Schekmanbacteria bacterium]|nr:TnsA endonuclease N-terminal domain-containing protein [Candidatus Schekmanbacteria bacterium]